MATGGGGDDDPTNANVVATAEHDSGVAKGKRNLNAAASFFIPLSKKAKLAPVADLVVEVNKNASVAGEEKDDDFQEPSVTSVLATIFDKKPSRKKANVRKDQKKEVENVPSLQDVQTGGSQLQCPPEHKQEVGQSPSKKSSKTSTAKKKRKPQQSVLDTKPSVGVHGADLFLQARLAAEENTRLSAGKATHPFFARPKSGGARSLGTDEAIHATKGRSLNSASDCAEKPRRMSPLKPPHPFFARQNLGGAKAMTVDEPLHSLESDSLPPSAPFHITQNMAEDETKPVWNSNWTWRDMPAKADQKIEGVYSFLASQPSYSWTWPSSEKRKMQPLSRVDAFRRVIDYLTGKDAGTQFLLGEEVESVAAETHKLVQMFSSYYYPYVHKDFLEPNSALQTSTERQLKDVNSSRNALWTDQYQPQTCQEVCGNKECVKTLSSWLQSWGEKILQQKGSVKNKEEEEGSFIDDDSDFEDSPSEIDDNDDLYNCLLVTGPVGCGKSAAIYACAMEHGFTVIEVNASECRSGALIKHKFSQAMGSHGLSKRQLSAAMDASDEQLDAYQMLKQGEGCRKSISFCGEPENQVPQSQSAYRSNLPPPSLRGLRVILFEDVDIVFEEDSGFMNALTQLSKTSKCPIIFSSNSQKPALPQVRGLQVIRFEQPSTAELVAHACMVCMAEGVSCSPDIVEHIVKTSDHDLRKLLMLLQFWTQGSPSDSKYWKDISAVEGSLSAQTNKQNPNLVNCLLQLDGCPRVPATRIHTADRLLIDEELNNIKPKNNSEMVGICQEPDPRNIREGMCLDSDRLFAYDCQHRILPLLFPCTVSCQLTTMVSKRLEDANQKVREMVDFEVNVWSRHRFDELKSIADAHSRARKALQKLQAAARKDENGKSCIKPSNGFSFMKLMQGSYDSPDAQTASNECTKDTLCLLQEHHRSSSEEREDDLTPACLSHDQDRPAMHPARAIRNYAGFQYDEHPKLLPPLDSDTLCTGSLPDVEGLLRGHECIPGLHFSVTHPIMADLGADSVQQSVNVSDATASQSTNFAVQSIVPSGLQEVSVNRPVEESKPDLTTIPIDNLTIHHDVETSTCAGEHSHIPDLPLEFKILNLTSAVMEYTWSELRSLPLKKHFTLDMDNGASILLDDILDDLSSCDFLSSRTTSAFKHVEVSVEQQRPGNDAYRGDSSGDSCTESAAVLAQLRLNQALNKLLPSNGPSAGTWEVRPSFSQQEIVREEKRLGHDECVNQLLPQRCRSLGRLARLDYISFYPQLTPSTAEIGRASC